MTGLQVLLILGPHATLRYKKNFDISKFEIMRVDCTSITADMGPQATLRYNKNFDISIFEVNNSDLCLITIKTVTHRTMLSTVEIVFKLI